MAIFSECEVIVDVGETGQGPSAFADVRFGVSISLAQHEELH